VGHVAVLSHLKIDSRQSATRNLGEIMHHKSGNALQNLRLALVQLSRLACVHGPPGAKTDLKEPPNHPPFEIVPKKSM